MKANAFPIVSSALRRLSYTPGPLGEVLMPSVRWRTVKQIDCVCGHVVKGDDDDELWEQAQDHIRTDHPDLVGKVSREDILAQAEET
jgi:predicted small metal-binding protein